MAPKDDTNQTPREKYQVTRKTSGLFVGCMAGLLLTGCAGAGPKLAPLVACSQESQADGGLERRYDMDADGRCDYREVLSPAGVLARLDYDSDQDGRFEEQVELAAVPADELHDLVIILDSVPIGLVREVWDQGRLRCVPRPSRVISPFPVMTDLCLAEFFGMAPCLGVEAEFFDGDRLSDAYTVYAGGGNAAWYGQISYWLTPSLHALAYLDRPPWFNHELRRIQNLCELRRASGERCTVGYVVGTSALGAGEARTGHIYGLTILDRFCRWMEYRSRGRVRISLFSDHGHAMLSSRRLLLRERLTELGYHVGSTLGRPGDVVVPEFGMVTCAAIHTREPAQVAADAIHIDGVDLAVYRESESSLIVVSRQGRARISRRDDTLCYAPITGVAGDAMGILALRPAAQPADAVCATDAEWLTIAADADYPDAVYRLWRSFHGLVKHTPDVMLNIQDGWFVGSTAMSTLFKLEASHGSLRAASSCGFAASMRGELPSTLRMQDLRAALQSLGVALPGPTASTVLATDAK